MRVLYLGAKREDSTSRHRSDALIRLGCRVDHIDPQEAIAAQLKGFWGALHYRTGYMLTTPTVSKWLEARLANAPTYDLCWVDSGELISGAMIRQLKRHCRHVVLFNHDDPTGPRDRVRFQTLRRAIPQYDLCLAVRDINLPEFKAFGARDVMHVWRSYDELAHRPLDPNAPVKPIYQNDIVFIGRCMDDEGRDLLMHALIKQGLKPAIWGGNWQRSSVWPALQPYWRGEALTGQDYVDGLRGAHICIGMLSKGNRDLHTTRTMEIPAAGGLLCAERTSEHLALYKEGEEAVFWSSPQECVDVCKRLLSEPGLVQRIKAAGQRRLIENKVGNEDICRAVFKRLRLE